MNPQIAGLQVALRANGLYLGAIDGVAGPKTAAAVHAFQRKKGLPVGVADRRTRLALGPLGRPLFGSRVLKAGDFGWDVAVLQFLMTRRGVYSGALDGYFGKETAAALRRYQKQLRLTADAVVGPHTLSAIVKRDAVPVRTHTAAAAMIYVVRAGDNLTQIARRFGTSVAGLAAANHIDPARPIVIGARLKVPARLAAPALVAQRSDVRTIARRLGGRLGVDAISFARSPGWSPATSRASSLRRRRAACCRRCRRRATSSSRCSLGPRCRTRSTATSRSASSTCAPARQFDGDERLALAAWYQGERPCAASASTR